MLPSRARAVTIVLEILEGPHAGSSYAFDRHATLLVGRGGGAQLRLEQDPYFSRHHYLLEFNPPRCYLRDLGSLNGTEVNGAKVKEAFLQDGDVIGGGQTRIRFTVRRPQDPRAATAPGCLGCGSPADADTLTAPNEGRVLDGGGTSAYVCPSCRKEIENRPQPVPGYELVRRLGKGGMGVVHLARRAATGEAVAVKLVVPEAAASAKAVQLFLREVSVLSQLRHPRIVRFHEAGTAGGQFFFVMEYVETVNPRDLLAPLAPAKQARAVCGIVCQVLEALAYAHERGFVHRDVKPANVLVTRIGQRLRTKLSDFGLGKNLENAGFSGMTRTGAGCGSLPFMPPEQVSDCRSARPPADMFGAGATLYFLLAGCSPYDFEAGHDPYAVVLDGRTVPLGEHRPDLPGGLLEIVHRALARPPEGRFGSAREMRAALLPYAKGTA
jgi:serine/threonine-protein kinase